MGLSALSGRLPPFWSSAVSSSCSPVNNSKRIYRAPLRTTWAEWQFLRNVMQKLNQKETNRKWRLLHSLILSHNLISLSPDFLPPSLPFHTSSSSVPSATLCTINKRPLWGSGYLCPQYRWSVPQSCHLSTFRSLSHIHWGRLHLAHRLSFQPNCWVTLGSRRGLFAT